MSIPQAHPSMKSYKYEQEELKVYWKMHKTCSPKLWDYFTCTIYQLMTLSKSLLQPEFCDL